MLIRLSVEVEGAHGSYEQLGQVGFGPIGKLVVLGSKFLYSFGCLIAYIIVVKDNFGPAARSLIYGNAPEGHSWLYHLLGNDFWMTWILSASVILPLCLLRDMTPLASLSVVSVVSMVGIVGIVIYLFAFNPNGEIRHPSGGAYEDWFEIRPAFLEWYVTLADLYPMLLQTTSLTHPFSFQLGNVCLYVCLAAYSSPRFWFPQTRASYRCQLEKGLDLLHSHFWYRFASSRSLRVHVLLGGYRK